MTNLQIVEEILASIMGSCIELILSVAGPRELLLLRLLMHHVLSQAHFFWIYTFFASIAKELSTSHKSLH
jgi:hypothetical protein